MKYLKDRNFTTGLISVLLGLFLFWQASMLKDSAMVGDPGPRVMPYIAAALLVIPGALLMCKREKTNGKPFLTKPEWKKMLRLSALYIAYVVMLWAVGYLLATFIMLTLLVLMFGEGRNISKVRAVIYSLVVTLTIYVLFVYALELRLPDGIVMELLGF